MVHQVNSEGNQKIRWCIQVKAEGNLRYSIWWMVWSSLVLPYHMIGMHDKSCDTLTHSRIRVKLSTSQSKRRLKVVEA